jgi:DNA-binding NarL/FixJ family response regulator
VVKDSAATEIIDCIQAVAAGKDYISPTLSSFLIRRGRGAAALVQQKPALAQLTPTERSVLKLIAEGQTSGEIAAALHIAAPSDITATTSPASWNCAGATRC